MVDRVIKKIVIHCSSSDNKRDDVSVMRFLHTRPIDERCKWNEETVNCFGFDDIAYHYIIKKNGYLHRGRDIDTKGAHCYGENHDSIGICLLGEYDFKPMQMLATARLVWSLCKAYGLDPYNHVYPHNKFNRLKTCPNFDIKSLEKFYPQLGELKLEVKKLELQVAHLESEIPPVLPGLNAKIVPRPPDYPGTPWWRFWS